MDIRIIVETTSQRGEKRTEELRHLSLIDDQCRGELGLKLQQGKALLTQVQGAILRHPQLLPTPQEPI